MIKKNLRIRIFVVLSIFFLIAIFLTSFILCSNYVSVLREQATLQNEQAINQLTKYLDSYLDEVNNLSVMPYYHTDIIDTLRDAPVDTPAQRLQKRRNLESFLNTIFLLPRKDILQVYIISDDVYYSSNPEIPRLPYDVQISSDWYKSVIESQNVTVLYPGADGINVSPHFSLINVIKDLSNNDSVLGVIKVDASFQTLKEVCNSIYLGRNGGVSIVAEDGTIVYSTINNLDDKDALISDTALNHFGWKIYVKNSLDDLHIFIRNSICSTLLFSLIIIVASVFIIRYFVFSSFKPLNSIVEIMKRVKGGDKDLRYIVERDDEIGYVGESLNEMLDQLDLMTSKSLELKQKIFETELAQRDIELRMLYGEIRPHFIYNTLNSISILIECGKYSEAVRLIDNFSSLLRGIAYINQDIFLSDEFAMIENYLRIHEIRFDYDFSYEIELDEECREIVIPSLIIQPIVENSILHGFNNSEKQFHISVTGHLNGNRVVLTISDNGKGIDEERLKTINYELSHFDSNYIVSPKDKGLGLLNICARLQLHYTDNYAFYVKSGVDEGTQVVIELPVEIEQNGCDS